MDVVVETLVPVMSGIMYVLCFVMVLLCLGGAALAPEQALTFLIGGGMGLVGLALSFGIDATVSKQVAARAYALEHAGLYREALPVENADGVGRYKLGERCLVDWRGTFAAVGSLDAERIMHYTRHEGVTAECPTGTLVAVTEEQIAQQRLIIAQAEAREQERKALTERAK